MGPRIVGFLLFSLCLALGSAAEYRLPSAVRPHSYFVSIATYAHENDSEYIGYVDIQIAASKNTSEIVLHAQQLRDFEISLKDIASAAKFEDLKYELQPQHATLTVFLPIGVQLLQGRTYLLRIAYAGQHGFFWHKSVDSQNRSPEIMSTRSGAFQARRVFPCFDEPALKANFTVTLTHSVRYDVVSNMPRDGAAIFVSETGMRVTKFQPTPPMAPSSLFIIITNYANITTYDSILQSAYIATQNSRKTAERILRLSHEVIKTLEYVLDEKFPLPKLELVLFPISNLTYLTNEQSWGLLSFNDDKSVDGVNSALRVAQKVAEQWFGGLVTAQWWDDAWIGSSLAALYSYRALDELFPELEVSKALDKNLDESFYGIGSHRGLNILRMMEHYLTKETFDKGVRHFLDRFKHSNYDETDFIHELQAAAVTDKIAFFKEPGAMAKVLKSWSHSTSFPTITVTRNYASKAITISQVQEESLFWIPMNFASSVEPSFEVINVEFVLPKVRNLTINSALGKLFLDASEWIVVNKQQTGFYIVNYDERNWLNIARALAEDCAGFHVQNRRQILRDVNILLERGQIAVETVLEILSYLSAETDLTVWESAEQILGSLSRKLKGTDTHEAFLSFAQNLLRQMYVSFENVPAVIERLACGLDLPECLDKASKYVSLPRSALALCHALKTASTPKYQLAITKLIDWEDDSEKNSLIYGLSCSRMNSHLRMFLQGVFSPPDDEESTPFHLPQLSALLLTMYHKTGRQLALDFAAKNRKQVKDLIKAVEFNKQNYSEEQLREYGFGPAETARFYKYMIQSWNELQEIASGDYQIAADTSVDAAFLQENEARIAVWLDRYDSEQVETVYFSGGFTNARGFTCLFFVVCSFFIY